MPKLKRTLGPIECIFFGVGSILGAGVYTLIGKVADWSGTFIWLAFVIASVTAICTAFSYAELSSAFPKAGGEYEYAKKAFGKNMGVLLGIVISLNGIVSGATVAVGFAGYLASLVSINQLIASLGIIGLIFLVNVSGVRKSSVVNIILTVIELGGLIFVIYAAFPSIGDVNYTEFTSKGINGLMLASALAFFAYIGFEDIVKLAEETKDPQKNIPIALFGSSIIVFIVYTVVVICAVSVLSVEELADSEKPLADVVKVRFGATGVIVISIIALFSTSNTILSNMLGSSRILFSMAGEVKALKHFAKVSSKRKTPVAALILILLTMLAFALIGKIETIARIATFFIFITFIIVNLSVIVLRRKQKSMERPFRIPLSFKNIPIISVLGIFLTLVLLGYNVYGLVIGGQ
jgi:amino acid transporter